METGGVNRGIKNLSDMDVIPPLPSREEELAYLDKLERELRSQPFKHKKFTTDPSRKKRIEMFEEEMQFKKSQWRSFVLGAFVTSPLALWVSGKLPTKASWQNIPYRSYSVQHKLRFWGCFVIFDYMFAKLFARMFISQELLDEYRYPLYKVKERKL